MDAEKAIELLDLKPMPLEGGFYRETYRSSDVIPCEALDGRYKSDRAYSTAIYYLLTPGTFSALHMLPGDEVFHFYLGDPVIMLQLHSDGSSDVLTLGRDIELGHLLQAVVPKNTWQGMILDEGGRFALMGTTMAPGFDFDDYRAGKRAALLEGYPHSRNIIMKLTPE